MASRGMQFVLVPLRLAIISAVLATSATARAEVEFDGEVALFELHLGEVRERVALLVVQVLKA